MDRRTTDEATVRVRSNVVPKLQRRLGVSPKYNQGCAAVWHQVGEIMEENRKLKQFLAIAGVVTLINGVGYTLVPGALLPNYAIQPTAGSLLGFRLFGAALLTFGLI